MPSVRKAVFPAAGLGTRFLPATKAQPKEMLPLVDKPIIQYGIEEAKSAGVESKVVHVTTDAPWESITSVAKKSKADAIVMASHGRRGLASLLLGSETTKVLTHSTVPVLVVR